MFDAGMIFCCDSYVLGARLLCEIFSAFGSYWPAVSVFYRLFFLLCGVIFFP
jgi:hypothetical protein